MSIRDLFRQTSTTVESLQQKYKSIESQKKSLVEKADSLRAESLKTDADVSEQLNEIREEISLSEVALSETEKALQAKIEKKIQSDFEGLNEQKLDFETKLNDLSRDAGTQLGQAVATLQTLNLPFASTLSRFIREEVINLNDHRRKDQMTDFLKTYGEAINSQSDAIDLRTWKQELMRIEQLQPGSPAALNHIRREVENLLRSGSGVEPSESIAWMFSARP